uniref:Uncharacterized protein n=1 Tax=Amphimedon queenslandica TaxID=400682 RepID=A0A1X7VRS5_AMPQE
MFTKSDKLTSGVGTYEFELSPLFFLHLLISLVSSKFDFLDVNGPFTGSSLPAKQASNPPIKVSECDIVKLLAKSLSHFSLKMRTKMSKKATNHAQTKYHLFAMTEML